MPELNESPSRILVVEDNIVNQQLALKLLKKMGFNAEIAENGVAALKALETCTYAVVLMDVQMPELDGIETTKIIRDPNSKILDHGVPIIALTAHAMEDERRRSIECGMDVYLTKPIHHQ